jgi:CHAT domain-containing protein
MLHEEAGEYGKAEPLVREALAMRRALYPRAPYPNGHPDLAGSLNNLALLYQDAGEYALAEPLYREALDMVRALFPKDKYPSRQLDLASSLNNLGFLHRSAREYGKAEPLFREALDIYRTLLLLHGDLAAEAASLNYLATQPLTRDGLLSVTGNRPAAATYGALWDTRALISRLQEQRHRELMASRDPAIHNLVEQLHRARLTLSQRLLRPLADPEANRVEVQRLTDAKEDLEKRISQQLNLSPLQSAEVSKSQRLAERLPAGTCFVDLYRYTHFEQDPSVKGKKGEKRAERYVAFVVSPGRAVARVELGDAETIERTWAAWHQTLTVSSPAEDQERAAAATLANQVWEPLRKELPQGVKTVYMTPDGDLHQLPWSALPGNKSGTVLLDEHALCLVPHGPFLLRRLEEAPAQAKSPGTLLAIGGIDYDHAPKAPVANPEFQLREAAISPKGVNWVALAGTEKERQQVVALAKQAGHLEVVERSDRQASTEQLQRDLPAASYAHLATHGFFADPQFRSALQIDPKEFHYHGVHDRRGGARSPLSLSGLVFAGANRKGEDMADDRGILTAEGLIGLRLEGMDLAVLSACETGLGAWGGGEGVYGLQRAFHVAGCRDVVASLWKVDDDATQALMALFYRNLWEKKMDAAEALRQAQLTLYRNPSAVTEAKKREFDFKEVDLPKNAVAPPKGGKYAPTAQWAAFTFSGVRPVKPE